MTIRSLRVAADRRVDDEEPQRDADLRRGQPDARRRVHRLDHVVDQPLEAVVEGRRRRRPAGGGARSPYRRIGRIIVCARSGRGPRRVGAPTWRASRAADRVAAEALEERVGEHERDHRLADDRRGRNGADVAALDRRRRLGSSSRDRRSAAASSASRSASCTPETRRSSPLVTPPSRPPALLVGRARPVAPRRDRRRARSRRGRAIPAARPPRARCRCRRP